MKTLKQLQESRKLLTKKQYTELTGRGNFNFCDNLEICDNPNDLVICLVETPFITFTKDSRYLVEFEGEQFLTNDLFTAEEFLWDNHLKHRLDLSKDDISFDLNLRIKDTLEDYTIDVYEKIEKLKNLFKLLLENEQDK